VEYTQAPGVHARNTTFRISGNQAKVLDFPDGGGTVAPNNAALVSLGMAGGYVVLEFDPPLENYAAAADFIVYGNAYYNGGIREKLWQEPGAVWVMADANGNGLPDDDWYLLAPAYKNSETDAWTPLVDSSSVLSTLSYDKAVVTKAGTADERASWWPEEADGESTLTFTDVLLLPDSLYSLGGSSLIPRGLADSAPSLIRGDLSGTGSLNTSGSDDDTTNGDDDYPGIDPVYFYTVADEPGDRDIAAKSGGGAAMDIAWAVNPAASFSAVTLGSVRWVKIVSGTTLENATGDYSTEIDAVVRALKP